MAEVEVRYATDVYRHAAVGFRRDLRAARPTGTPVTARPDLGLRDPLAIHGPLRRGAKLRTLHQGRVRFYWLLDPEHGTHTVLKHEESAYATILTAASGDIVTAEPFSARTIEVARLLGNDI